MAPPKKQKREYGTGEAVWVKVKGWPIWPGQVEDPKNVTNDSVLKKKRKNAILIKFLETQTYNWASQEDVNPFQKETFDNFLISGNHKNFKTWKKAFKLVAKDAGVEADTITETINKAKTRKASSTPQKRKGRENEVTTPSKKRKSASNSPSPKRTARHASTGGRKSSTPKKVPVPKKSIVLRPTIESNEALLNELNTLLVKYSTEKDNENVYQLLKIISNFSLASHDVLSTVPIGDTIQKIATDNNSLLNIQKIATKITEYYASLKVEEIEEEKKEETKEENGEVKAEDTETKVEEKKEDIVITENTDATPVEDKMETVPEAKPVEPTA